MEWINIQDRPPRLGLTCLVVEQGFGIDGNYYYGYEVATYIRNPIHPRKGMPVFAHQLQIKQRLPWVYDDVTHWMPLPSLPEMPNKETYMRNRWGDERKDKRWKIA